MYCVYILYSTKRDRYYIGSTGDGIEERIRKHNTNHKGFTGGAGDWILVYSESSLERTIALEREREIKGWKSRKMIERLINSSAGSEHPD